VIEYRTFRNTDPPRVTELWEQCGLGRGAAGNLRADAFECLVFAQPFFDRDGFVVACEGERVVGFAHAGFGSNNDETGLRHEVGVVCAVLVHPAYRLQGIGRKLVRRAEDYLHAAGAVSVYAGQAEPLDPFYFGLYGGCQPSGFLLSDGSADPFLRKIGYIPFERHAVFQKDLTARNDPMTMRLAGVRRKMQLAIAHQRHRASWWWVTRLGRLDTVRFHLQSKSQGEPVAEVTVLGLDLYLDKWQERAVGLTDLFVLPEERLQGYGQALLIEVCRRMQEEMVTRVEAHAAESNTGGMAVLESAGFTRVDTGVVYQLVSEGDSTFVLRTDADSDADLPSEEQDFDDGDTIVQSPDQPTLGDETTVNYRKPDPSE
jgi:ribosomal protein S18 acetylase RimI-like enzyme